MLSAFTGLLVFLVSTSPRFNQFWWRIRNRPANSSSNYLWSHSIDIIIHLSLFFCSTHMPMLMHNILALSFQILIYCRSSTPPQYQLPSTVKLFTLDVMYLHDKPGPDNCPQVVYDTLVDALERISEFEGYIHESGQGLTRALFRNMCQLLCHPQQRCNQDELDLPKSLVKKSTAVDSAQGDDSIVVSSQWTQTVIRQELKVTNSFCLSTSLVSFCTNIMIYPSEFVVRRCQLVWCSYGRSKSHVA